MKTTFKFENYDISTDDWVDGEIKFESSDYSIELSPDSMLDWLEIEYLPVLLDLREQSALKKKIAFHGTGVIAEVIKQNGKLSISFIDENNTNKQFGTIEYKFDDFVTQNLKGIEGLISNVQPQNHELIKNINRLINKLKK